MIQEFQRRHFTKIGGPGIRIQVDDTVIVRGRLITNPSSSNEEIPNSIWLLGGIEETVDKKFF